MVENKMDKIESLLIWLVSGEKDEDGNWLSDDDTQLVCDALEYYLNMHGQKNKMAQIAKMFGKELDEPFKIRFNISNGLVNGVISYAYYVFTENGLCRILEMGTAVEAYALLYLLNGNAEIVEDEK